MGVYHVELRAFPKQVHRFNLTGAEVGAIVLPWVQERIVEVGEQKWSPHQATLTIIEGPELEMDRVSMGRGWRLAEREGHDVTERVLQEARQALVSGSAGGGQGVAAGPPTSSPAAGGAPAAAPDPLTLGVELAALLGPDPAALLSAWRAIAARAPELSPSESLALAERELGARAGGDER